MDKTLKEFILISLFFLGICTIWYYAYVKPADDARFSIIQCSYGIGGPTRENLATCSNLHYSNP